MRYRVDIDFDANCPVSCVLEFLEKHQATIVNTQAFGPAGGNPNFLLEFDNYQSAVNLLTEFYYDRDCQHYIDNIVLI
jgi:hypothetical protein